MVSFFGVTDGQWSWTGAPPQVFDSSPGVRRSFCARCGTPMAFASDRFPGETHFYAASMDAPEGFDATFHTHAEERLSWVKLSDGLPEHEGTTG